MAVAKAPAARRGWTARLSAGAKSAHYRKLERDAERNHEEALRRLPRVRVVYGGVHAGAAGQVVDVVLNEWCQYFRVRLDFGVTFDYPAEFLKVLPEKVVQ